MKKLFIILVLLLCSTVYSSTLVDIQGGVSIGGTPSIRVMDTSNPVSATSYWHTAMTDRWNTAMTALWNTTMTTEVP